MEQTLQTQYNLIKEGKGNKAYFLKSAFRLFPDMLSPVNTFEDTIAILKNRSIISEGIGGLVTTGKKQDWMSIFNENMDKIKENSDMDKHNLGVLKALLDDAIKNQDQDGIKYLKGEIAKIEGDEFTAAIEDFEEKDTADANISPINYRSLKEVKETEEPSKEVLDKQKHAYDNKDEKNYDNIFGQEFLKGYYTELKDPKNADKDVEELRAIVAKNLAKDISFYVKDGQFGVKGLGYTTEAPGLGEPKEPKGKFKSSGYGDIPKSKSLEESVLRSQIHLLIKEVLSENSEFKKDDNVEFNGDIWTVIGTSVDSDGDKFVEIELGDKTHEDVPVNAVTKVEIPSLKPGEIGIYNGEKLSIVAISVDNGKRGYTIKKNDKIYRGIPFSAVTKTVSELQQDPKAYADEEEFETKLINKLKSDLRTKNKHHQSKTGEPDMDLVHYYADAIKFVGQNIKDIADKFLNHSKPEGGVDDAIKFALSNVDSNPINETKKK